MQISLRRGKRIFVNGAVIRVDRKVTIELMNDVTFLLEHHIIQPEEASSPLKKLYLVIQTILMSPNDKVKSIDISLELIGTFLLMTEDKILADCLIEVRTYLEADRPFDALKTLRSCVIPKSGLTITEYNRLSSMKTG